MHQREPNTREPDSRWIAKRGQILVMFAAGLFLLVGMIALAIDAGFLMAERRQVQSAADSGALAAARAKLDYLYESNVNAVQVQTGKQYGARNADTSEDNVDVDTDPSMDGFDDVYVDGINRYVEVTVSKDVNMFFLQALYDGDWGTSATAIAGVETVGRPYALLALGCGSGSNGGIHIGGSGKIDVNEGSIMSNCRITSSGAAGSSIVTAGGAIDAYGEIQSGPNWSADEGIHENRPQISDPIKDAGIEPPSKPANSVTTQDQLHEAVTGSNKQGSTTVRCPNEATCTMGPGHYGGNLTLDVHGTLVMQPGIYYFDGSFKLEGQSSNTIIRGEDVLLYFASGSTARFDPKNAHIELSAPGAEAGNCDANLDAMVLWIDNGTSFMMQSAEANFQLDGVIYAPESRVRLFGGPYSSGMQVIVKSIELSGGNDFDILFLDCIPGESPRVFLVQ